MNVLKIRDENGKFIPINAIKGDDGKSAYEQAKDGGYTGTEEEFAQSLNLNHSNEALGLEPILTRYAEDNDPTYPNKFEVTIPYVNELKDGVSIYVKFNDFMADSGVTLNVNGLGAKSIHRVVGWGVVKHEYMSLQNGGCNLYDSAVRLRYYEHGDVWLLVDYPRPIVFLEKDEVWGRLPVMNGGTGADNAADARANLGAMSKAEYSPVTMLASEWSEKVYSFESSYPHSVYDIEIYLDGDSITSEQKTAFETAEIVGSLRSNTVKALGEVPTIDIPIIVKVVYA